MAFSIEIYAYKFSSEMVTKLVKTFPENIIGCKDSSYNLFESLKLPNFLMFPGSQLVRIVRFPEISCDAAFEY